MHMDIKCENLLLTDEGKVLIADFGYSRFNEYSGKTAFNFEGTYGYNAPEMYEAKF